MFLEVLGIALPPLISTLTQQFLERHRKGVPVAEVQEQVTQLVVSQRSLALDVAEVQRATAVLLRYLAAARGDMFSINEERLELTERSAHLPDDEIAPALYDFRAAVERGVKVRLEQQSRRQSSPADAGSGASRGDPRPTANQAKPAMLKAEEKALDDFFEGLSEEIRDTRLGRISSR